MILAISYVLPLFEIANTIDCHFNTIDHIDHQVVLNGNLGSSNGPLAKKCFWERAPGQ